MEFKGCREGNATPKMAEAKCPRCGEMVEVFVKAGSVGRINELYTDETCPKCGYVFEAGTHLSEYNK